MTGTRISFKSVSSSPPCERKHSMDMNKSHHHPVSNPLTEYLWGYLGKLGKFSRISESFIYHQ